MRIQTSIITKKRLAILLAVLFLLALTTAAASVNSSLPKSKSPSNVISKTGITVSNISPYMFGYIIGAQAGKGYGSSEGCFLGYYDCSHGLAYSNYLDKHFKPLHGGKTDYDKGYADGYNDAYLAAYKKGYNSGYRDCLRDKDPKYSVNGNNNGNNNKGNNNGNNNKGNNNGNNNKGNNNGNNNKGNNNGNGYIGNGNGNSNGI